MLLNDRVVSICEWDCFERAFILLHCARRHSLPNTITYTYAYIHTKSQITTRKNICTDRTCFLFSASHCCYWYNIRVVFTTSTDRKTKIHINRKQRQINSRRTSPKITTNKQHSPLLPHQTNCTNNKNKMFIIC